MGYRGAALVGLVVGSLSCETATFGCLDDSECSAAGVCAEPGYCAFPQDECESGLSFGKHASPELAGQCVPESPSGTTGGGQTDSGAASSDGPADPSTTIAVDGSGGTDGSTTAAADTVGTSSSSTGSGESTGSGGSDGSSSVGAATTTDGVPVMQTVSYPASFATCVLLDAPTPSPEQCVALTQPHGMTVDLEAVSGMPGASAAMLLIPVGAEFENTDVVEVRLRLRTLTDPSADSMQSGEVWRVGAFTSDSLGATLPEQLDAMSLAGDLGPSTPDTDVVWVLPADVLVPDADLHLGIYPVHINGVDYVTHLGDAVPVIEVDYID